MTKDITKDTDQLDIEQVINETPEAALKIPKFLDRQEKKVAVTSKFDPARLRLSQDFEKLVGVKKHVTTVPVRKPHRQEFVRVRPGPEYRLETAILEVKEDRELYLVDPALLAELPNEITPRILLTSITRQGVLSLWPIRLPDQDGKIDAWSLSAMEAAKLAESNWIRLASNRNLGAYEVYEASGNFQEPEWPQLTFQEILEIAFKGRFIETDDHPVLKKLRGEI